MKMFELGQEVWFVYELRLDVIASPEQCLMVCPGYVVGMDGTCPDSVWKYRVRVTESNFLNHCTCDVTPQNIFSSHKAAENALKLREQELLKERKAAFVELGKMLRQYKERRNGE